MANGLLIIAMIVVAAVIVFGAANIITASQRISPTFKQINDETNLRCDQCLSQFSSEVSCTHLTESKVCTALRNYYCNTNCTLVLLN
jgi:putative exporter of polyketide antibiotics